MQALRADPENIRQQLAGVFTNAVTNQLGEGSSLISAEAEEYWSQLLIRLQLVNFLQQQCSGNAGPANLVQGPVNAATPAATLQLANTGGVNQATAGPAPAQPESGATAAQTASGECICWRVYRWCLAKRKLHPNNLLA